MLLHSLMMLFTWNISQKLIFGEKIHLTFVNKETL